jgi:hypothetical protein
MSFWERSMNTLLSTLVGEFEQGSTVPKARIAPAYEHTRPKFCRARIAFSAEPKLTGDE